MCFEMSMAVESTCGIAVTLINLYLKLEVFFIPDGHQARICVEKDWNFCSCVYLGHW